jgi:hypothetical protein
MTCMSTSINAIANDTDPEGNIPLALVSVTQGAKGTARVLRSVYYTAGSQTGTDVLTYTVRDSLGAASTGTITITITAGQC